jgi:putative cardiolipin synthase
MKLGKSMALGVGTILLALAGVRILYPLPALDGRSVSAALLDTSDTRIGRSVATIVAKHAEDAGIYLLPNGRDAFAARRLLAASAERSLDVQYYIWRGDRTGTLLFDELRVAADRGVRVRLLLDDNNTAGLDATLAALDSHGNIEVRLFNPFVIRGFRAIGYVTDFFRLNRRMHNKSFTADNQATIIGGRNVGDEYFDAVDDTPAFVDLDVLAIGTVVQAVSRDFDRYWASRSSYPAEQLLSTPVAGALAELRAAAANVGRQPGAVGYLDAIRSSAVIRGLIAGTLAFEWAPTRMISDDPAKVLGLAAAEQLFPEQLLEVIGSPGRELDLVSPYFVPTEALIDAFTRLTRRGVGVRILVNSLAATDVTAVHSGYAKHRKQLLKSGIAIYEMRLVAPPSMEARADRLGHSATSLHAKTFAVDRDLLFIGSFNFDPRSAHLNTELGFVVESPALANRLAAFFDDDLPARAYKVHLSEAGHLYWTEHHAGQTVRHDVEPGTTWGRRAVVWGLSLLPIESLL